MINRAALLIIAWLWLGYEPGAPETPATAAATELGSKISTLAANRRTGRVSIFKGGCC